MEEVEDVDMDVELGAKDFRPISPATDPVSSLDSLPAPFDDDRIGRVTSKIMGAD